VNIPLDMDAIGKTASIAITNAGHGSTAVLVLSVVPQLLLSLNCDQTLVGSDVEKLGAGLSAPHRNPAGMEHKLELILNESSYKEAANQFAQSYRDTDVTSLTDKVLSVVNSLLVGQKKKKK